MAQETKKPTQLHLRRLRKQGVVPRSPALTKAAAFLLTLSIAPISLGFALTRARHTLLYALRNADSDTISATNQQFHQQLESALLSGLLVCAIAVTTTLVLHVVQARGITLTAPRRLSTRQVLLRLSPLRGFEVKEASALATSILLSASAWLIVVQVVVKDANLILATQGHLDLTVSCLTTLSRRVLYFFAALALALGGIDYLLRVLQFRKRNRMTTQQVRRDERDQLGSPELLAQRKRLQTAMAGAGLAELLPRTKLIIDDASSTAILLSGDPTSSEHPRFLGVVSGAVRQSLLTEAARLKLPVSVNVWIVTSLKYRDPTQPMPREVEPLLADIWASIKAHYCTTMTTTIEKRKTTGTSNEP